MFRDFVEHLLRQKHCFACKHFKSNFSRYSSFDFGICLKSHISMPYEKGWCGGLWFEPCNDVAKVASEYNTKNK